MSRLLSRLLAARVARQRANSPAVRHRRRLRSLEELEDRLVLAAPSVLSIAGATPPLGVTSARSVSYAVTFSEPVTGVDPTDFQVVTTGTVTTASPVVVAGSGAAYQVTIPGIVGAGTLGLNLVDDGSIRDADGNFLTAPKPTFSAARTAAPTLGAQQQSMAMGDINGDGKPDLAVVSRANNFVSVLLGNGDGTFQTQPTLAVGTTPLSVALGDVNGDGKLDIAIANSGDATVSVLLGNGNGTFQPQQTFAVGSVPSSVALGDINGDGKLDIAVANSGDATVSVLLGNGNGTFQSQPTIAVGTSPVALVLGDLNGDHKLDVAVANSGSNTVGVLLGNGNGTFQPQQTFAVGSVPTSLALGDINGDGKLDLVAANRSNDVNDAARTVSALLGNGDGTFQAQRTSLVGRYPVTVALGDINGDGKLDVAVANAIGGRVTVVLGNGDGTFGQDQYGLITLNTVDGGLALGDVNGDRRTDILSSGYATVGVLLNSTKGSFQGPAYTILQTHPSVVSINGTNPPPGITNASSVTYTVTFSEPVTGVDPTDFQVVTTGTVTAASPVAVAGSGAAYQVTIPGIVGAGTLGLNLVDDGSIRDADGNRLMAPTATFAAQKTFAVGANGPAGVGLGDVNGDGKTDLVVTNGLDRTVGVLLGNGDATFQAQQTSPVGGTQDPPYDVALGDVDGDGKLDLAVTQIQLSSSSPAGVLLGNGNGTFQPRIGIVVASSFPRSLALVDVDGDGKPDLVIPDFSNSRVVVSLGGGSGGFVLSRVAGTFAAGTTPVSVALGDVNGDGKLDIAVANYGAATVGVLLGNGDGTFQPPQSFAVGSGPVTVALGDLNGDGKLDIAVANYWDSTVGVLLGNGNGTFQAQRAFPIGAPPSPNNQRPVPLVLGDVNGDGKLDVVVTHYDSNTVRLLLGNGDGTLQPQQSFAVGSHPVALALGDVNGDGKPDLAVANQDSHTVSVLVNADQGSFTGTTYTITRAATTTTAIAAPEVTYNGDGLVTVTVASPGGTPAGTVQLSVDGGAPLSSGPLAGGTATFDLPSPAAGDHALVAAYLPEGDFAPSSAAGTLHVSPAPTTTSIAAAPLTYGAPGSVVVSVVSAAGTPTGDVSLRIDGTAVMTHALVGGSWTFATSVLDAGGHTLAASFAAQGNFAASQAGGSLSVAARPITVTADAQGKTYGDGDPALTYQVTSGSLVGPDAFTGALARDPGEDVGSYAIGRGTLALSHNYDLSYIGARLGIAARPITVTADAQGKTYGDGDPALTYHITAGSLAFSDAFTGALARDPGEDVGSYAIQQGSLALGHNYDLSYQGATLNIRARPLTIAAANATKTYGDALSFAGTEFTTAAGGLVDGQTIARVALASTGAAATAPVGGSPYPITASGAVAGPGTRLSNYAITYANGALTVNPASLTVTADDQSRGSGTPNPPLTVHYSGFQNGENLATGGVTGTPALSTPAAPGSPPGRYPIVVQPGTLAAANYRFLFVPGTLTVTPASRVPTATVRLNTSSPHGNDILTARATKSDADGQRVRLAFVWMVNRRIVRVFASTTAQTDRLALGPLRVKKGDLITVRVTPSDGLAFGATVSAGAVVVGGVGNSLRLPSVR